MTEQRGPSRKQLLDGHLERLAREVGVRGVIEQSYRENNRARFLETFEGCRDLWVFAYGSLISNPAFRFQERKSATIYGYHRSFCVWSHFGRGTRARPGLTLGLDTGGSCCGVAYRIAREVVEQESRVLWAREMLIDVYVPVWFTAWSGQSNVRAVAFIANRASPSYAGHLSERRQLSIISSASGTFGSSLDYLKQLVLELARCGISAPMLHRLHSKVVHSVRG